MTKLLRAIKAEQRKLWSKGSLLGCFVSVFVVAFAVSFLCSVIQKSDIGAELLPGNVHAAAAFGSKAAEDWKEATQSRADEIEKLIASTAVELAESDGVKKSYLELQMSGYLRELAVMEFRLDNELAVMDWSGAYSLILCLWLMTPVVAVISCIYASDMFGGEFSRGTMRMILSRPATRLKIYIAKLFTALLLGGLLLAVAYGASGIGCGIMMEKVEGVYVGYVNGSVYSMGWSRHIFLVFCCCCVSVAVSVSLCAALGNIFRSRGISAGLSVILPLMSPIIGRVGCLVDSGILGLALPLCYDLTVPLCAVPYCTECSFITCALSTFAHFLVFVYAGYAGFRKDV